MTSLRWFAALAVFVCHVCVGRVRHDYGWWTAGGPAGVGFFFVLSGFVLAWSWRADESVTRFWRRRFARVYPATAVSTIAAIVLAWLSVPHMVSSPWVLTHFALVQAWLPLHVTQSHVAGNPVTWSLVCEAFFYALLPVLLPLVRHAPRSMLAASVAGALLVFVLALRLNTDYLYACPLCRLPEFMIGVCMGAAAARGWRPTMPAPIAAALLGCGWWLIESVPSGFTQVKVDVLLPGAIAVIACAARFDLDDRPGLLTSRPMVYLGELSFCFYLTHQLCLRVVEGFTGSLVIDGIVGFPLAFATAAMLHHGVELPMQRRILRGAQKTVAEPVLATA